MPWSSDHTEYSIHWVQHTLSTAYTKYSIHQVQLTPSTAYTEYSIQRVQHTVTTVYNKSSIHRVRYHPKIDCLPLKVSLSPVISQVTFWYSILYIRTIIMQPTNWVSAPHRKLHSISHVRMERLMNGWSQMERLMNGWPQIDCLGIDSLHIHPIKC